MRSVPVGRTIAHAYGFAGRRALPLLGLGWLSAFFFGLGAAFLLRKLGATMLVSPDAATGRVNDFTLFYLFCLLVLLAFANAAIALAMTREARSPGPDWMSAHLSITRREWSLFFAYVRLYGFLIAAVVAILLAGNVAMAVSKPLIAAQGGWQVAVLPPLISSIATIGAFAAASVLAIRFGFFAAPLADAESSARLLQSWTISGGNFWRLLVLSLALWLPVAGFVVMALWSFAGPELFSATAAAFSAPYDARAFYNVLAEGAVTIAAVWSIALLLINALFAGASASVYAIVASGPVRDAAEEYSSLAEPVFAHAHATGQPEPAHHVRFEPIVFSAPPAPIVPLQNEASGVEEPLDTANGHALNPLQAEAPNPAPNATQAVMADAAAIPPIDPAGAMFVEEHAGESLAHEVARAENPIESESAANADALPHEVAEAESAAAAL